MREEKTTIVILKRDQSLIKVQEKSCKISTYAIFHAIIFQDLTRFIIGIVIHFATAIIRHSYFQKCHTRHLLKKVTYNKINVYSNKYCSLHYMLSINSLNTKVVIIQRPVN